MPAPQDDAHPPAAPIRVLIVDDSAFMRRAIRQMLTSDPAIEVVGAARHGREGLALAAELRPDVITLDIEMPEMDGLTALTRIMRDCPTQVLMLSSLTTEGSHAALRALKLGAADVLAKDTSQVSLGITDLRDDLVRRVRALGHARRRRSDGHGTKDSPPTIARSATAGQGTEFTTPPRFRPGQFDVVCIGSSTGGPPVLETLLASLPPTFRIPILIAQHMPALFTASMAQRLDDLCPLPVVHAQHGMTLQRGTIYIAPGGRHLHLHKTGLARWQLQVNDQPRDALYRPSVDALFHSAAQACGHRTLALILTGMGHDGTEGGTHLHQRGATLLAQNEETCVVYGMPKTLTEQALVTASLPPTALAQTLATLADPPHPATAPTTPESPASLK